MPIFFFVYVYKYTKCMYTGSCIPIKRCLETVPLWKDPVISRVSAFFRDSMFF